MISVIIPSYNEETDIGRCLESLFTQKNAHFEIIVVDDGSTDNSKLKTQNSKLQLKIKNLRYFEQNHQGPGAARNFGAKHAKGKILVFVDSDMTFEEDFLYDLTQPIVEGKTNGTFTKNEFVSNWQNVWARCWNYNQGIGDKRRIPENYPETAPVFRAILKKEFEKVFGFDLIGYTDDWSLSRKLGYQAKAVEGATCYHKNPESLKEVYEQTRWIGKNEFISKGSRKIINLFRYFIPVSLLIGLFKAIYYRQAEFVIFKLVYDLGIFISVVDNLGNKSLYK